MPIDQSSATALVRFTGLGIICFNDDAQRGEIAVIRDDKHQLSVKLQQPVYQNQGGNDVIVYQDIAIYEQLAEEGVEIEIAASGSPSVEGYELYQSGEFDRLGDADVNDFRWIVNIDDLHPAATLAPTGEPPFPLTKIRIGNGAFYTHKLDTELAFEIVGMDAHGNPGEPATFGNVAETIGVKLDGDQVDVTILTAAGRQTHSLERVEGLPFRIEIKNMDYNENAAYSDMPDYYGYLASSDGMRFDLNPIDESVGGGGGAVNQKQFCHPVSSNLHSIDQL
jgi:hypothetical protein